MPFYEKGDVRIRYEETGSGFPLLVTPGGGLNSRISNWPTAVIVIVQLMKTEVTLQLATSGHLRGAETERVHHTAQPHAPP